MQPTPNWRFQATLIAERAVLIQSPDLVIAESLAAAYTFVLAESGLLASIVCQACSGFGHCARDCATRAKLTNLGGCGSKATPIIAAVRERIATAAGHFNQAGAPRSMIHVGGAGSQRKRDRVHSEDFDFRVRAGLD